MMRIAVAGTGGLARLIAHFIDDDTGHHVVILSRTVRTISVSTLGPSLFIGKTVIYMQIATIVTFD